MSSPKLKTTLESQHPWKMIVRAESKILIETFVDLFEDHLRTRLAELSPKPLGLATGRTMEPIYAALVKRLKAWSISDLKKLQMNWCSFNLDEYIGLSERNPNSFTSYMTRHVREPLNLSAESLRVPNTRVDDLQKAASVYAEQLKSFGGLGFQLLGLGSNGHVGFNEPPCGPDHLCRVVTLSESTRKQNAEFFGGAFHNVPLQAITLGMREILAADEIHLIVIGKSKAKILKSLLSSPCSNSLPASWLKCHPKLSLWADNSALNEIRVEPFKEEITRIDMSQYMSTTVFGLTKD